MIFFWGHYLMSKIEIKQEDALSLKLSHLIESGTDHRIDLYFSLPKEMGINAKSLDEEEYYHSAITGCRAYYSHGLHLPLVQGRFASLNNRTIEEFRLYLNLFAYQFAVAIETDANDLRQVSDQEAFYLGLAELVAQVESLLKKFRRNEPSDDKWRSYFGNADNYLSWFCEQQLLKLLSTAPRCSDYSEIIHGVLALCRNEKNYRIERHYNSSNTMQDANRISNKMLLLRRLLQRGVVLKEEQKLLGTWLKKLTTGVATGLIMLVVSALIIKAKGFFSGLTLALVVALAFIYAFREIFKDDIRNAMWRKIQRGRPRWSRLFRDTTSKKVIAKQLVWFDFSGCNDLPAVVDEILKRRHRQNKVESEILHYGISTRTAKEGFLAGYSIIKEQISFSLVPFSRYLERGKVKIYQENEGKVSHESAERRYQVNLVVVLDQNSQTPSYARYKITMNRSAIVEVTQSELPEHIPSIAKQVEEKMQESIQEMIFEDPKLAI